MLADKGYDGDDVRSSLLMHGILPVIPPKPNRKEPIACDFKAYKNRNRIESMFNRLKQFRRIATRYDKTVSMRGRPQRLCFRQRTAALIMLPGQRRDELRWIASSTVAIRRAFAAAYRRCERAHRQAKPADQRR